MPYLICSKSCEKIAHQIARKYFSREDDVVIGVGGGTAIDKAKLYSYNRRCIAVPTTASGAAMTSHAVIWGEEKKDVTTRKPILLKVYYEFDIELKEDVINDTFTDCLCHCFESLISDDKTEESIEYARQGIALLGIYLKTKITQDLIEAGNYGGQAIEIAKTNIIHKPSYKYTLKGLTHGQALRKIIQEKGFSSCQDLKKLYMDIVQSPLISYTLDT